MNILHLIAGPGAGGAEVYIKDLAIAMTQQGHNLHIGFWGYAEDFGRSKDFEKNYLAELRQNNIKYFFIGYESRKKPWLGLFRVRKYVKKNNIDIYHSHFLYGVLFGFLTKIPKIYTHHNSIFQVNKKIFKLFDSLIDQYIGISTTCSEILSGYTKKKINTIINGVSLLKFKEKTHLRKIKQNINILAIGRITPQKNYSLLIDSISLLPTNIKTRINVSITGEGSDEYTKSINKHIQDKKLSNTIKLIGNHSNIPELMTNYDLFVMSSAWEGLPIALLEATISGLPCIVTNVGGCSEVINTCKNGIIVEPGDANKFSDAIASYFNNYELLSIHSENAIKYSSVYSIETATKKHLNVYQEAYNK